MPATRRKTAAATTNVPARPPRLWPNPQLDDWSHERRASLAASNRGEKAISADIAIEEAIKSQTRDVKDICRLRNADATSPRRIPPNPRTVVVVGMAVVIGGIVDIAPYMGRIKTPAVVVGIVMVDRGRTYR